ncbi:MAG: GNAT family N-acetyltransferase [Chloroflexi bacterium]|nr:GNAT family N-acetyltransferase [Chloroflexota bacterium]
MIHIIAPQQRHIQGLIHLSRAFACESQWAGSIPIGQIHTQEAATQKLFGDEVVTALIVETDAREMVGYVGIYSHQEMAYISVMVEAAYRGKGVGKRLVQDAFGHVPSEMVVEAWIGEFNQLSLTTMPQMGFRLDRTIEDDDRLVHVFIRQAEKH